MQIWRNVLKFQWKKSTCATPKSSQIPEVRATASSTWAIVGVILLLSPWRWTGVNRRWGAVGAQGGSSGAKVEWCSTLRPSGFAALYTRQDHIVFAFKDGEGTGCGWCCGWFTYTRKSSWWSCIASAPHNPEDCKLILFWLLKQINSKIDLQSSKISVNHQPSHQGIFGVTFFLGGKVSQWRGVNCDKKPWMKPICARWSFEIWLLNLAFWGTRKLDHRSRTPWSRTWIGRGSWNELVWPCGLI